MTYRSATLSLILALACIAGTARADEGAAAEPATSPGRVGNLLQAFEGVPGDLKNIFGYPFEHSADFSKYALGVALLMAVDKPVTRAYQDHVEQPLSGFRVQDAPGRFKTLGTGGTDGWLLLGITGTYLGGFALGDDRMQQTALASTKSLAYSMLVTQVVLKTIAGRKRPAPSLSSNEPSDGTYTDNPYDFGNSRKPTLKSDQYGSSFPSFHFTAWFAVAKVYQKAYDDYVVPYSLLTVGLVSNIQGHKHWVSDMVAGALIGTLIGDVSARSIDSGRSKVRVDPAFGPAGPGLQLSYRF